MLEWLKKKAKDIQSGGTDFQTKKRDARAKARVPEYFATSQWMAEKGGETSFNAATWAELIQKARFRPGQAASFLANRNDIERKLAHGGGANSILTALTREDGTVFVVWWVQRDGGGQFGGLKPYYSIAATEKPSDYWVQVMDTVN